MIYRIWIYRSELLFIRHCSFILLRFFNFLTLVMVVISFILCLVQGVDNKTYYLLACNTVISSFVGIVVNWWYRCGDLGPEKFWYIFLLGGVIIFQCITTDMFVFHVLSDDSSNIIPPVANKTTIFPAISIRTGSTVPTYYGHWENSLLHNWLNMYMSFHLYYIYIANIL